MRIILIILLLEITWAMYMIIRCENVLLFRRKIINEIFSLQDWQELSKEYEKVSIKSMLFSFKPLKIERWFSKEFCEKIKQIE